MKHIAEDLARRLALFSYLLERPGGARSDEILHDLPRHYGSEGASVESAKRMLRRDIEKLAADGFYIVFAEGVRSDAAGPAPSAGPASSAGAAGSTGAAGSAGSAGAAGSPGVPGVPGEGRYAIDARRTFSAPVSFDDDEAAFLRVACASLVQDASYPRAPELLGALARLSDELDVPDTLLSLLDAAPSASALPSSIVKVRRALAGKTALSFSYTDAHGTPSRRTVAPLRVFTFNRHLYLVACDIDAEGGGQGGGQGGGELAGCGHGEGAGRIGEPAGDDGENNGHVPGEAAASGALRVFRLDRMSHVKKEKAASAALLDVAALDARAADAWPCLPFQFSARRFPAKVRFSPAAYAQASALTMRRGALTREPDGGGVWEVEAADARALAAWCVENGPGLQPVEPEEACTEFWRILDGAKEACSHEL